MASPSSFSPRDMRRAARANYRAQQAQARWQRAFYRRPSIAGPLLLLAVGTVALLLEMGTLAASRFWLWYSTWWPLVLIALGAVLLVEHLFDRRTPGVSRRPMGGFFGLLVLLSLLGLGSHSVMGARGPWGEHLADMMGQGDDWLGMLGDEHTRDTSLTKSIAPDGKLLIDNARGDVEVAAGTAGSAVEVEAHQIVHVHDSHELHRAFADVDPAFSRGSDGEVLRVPGREGAVVGLRVSVPPGVELTIHTNHGDVSLSGLKADVSVANSHGDVSADGIAGTLHAQLDHGSAIIHDVSGDVVIEGSADDVTVSEVRGKMLMNGDFFGETRVSSVGSSVHFHSPRTDLEMSKLAGELSMDKGDLHLDNVLGPLKLKAESKDVVINGLAGDATIDDSNGDVEFAAGAPLGNLNLSADTGSMRVTVPRSANFSVHASASDSDDLESDVSGTTTTGNGRKILVAQVGQGGPHLELTARHGDLSLHRGDPGDTPAPPPPPSAPGKGARRFHTPEGEPPPTPTVQ